MRLSDIGEAGLLQRLHAFCPAEIIGDDAAWFCPPAGKELVITTDVLVEGVHFSSSPLSPLPVLTMSATDVGWRSVAANYSDLAAMGAQPLGITVGLGLPPALPVAWVDELYAGMREILQTYGGVIWGGDVVRSPVVSVSITAVGWLDNVRIQRSTAQVGDWLVATGYHGLSRAGLEMIQNGIDAPEIAPLVAAHRRPQPRLDVVTALRELGIRRAAGMDTSDGLADAVWQICRASQVGAKLGTDIPVHPLLEKCFPQQAEAWLWYGGEDFELVLALAPDVAQQLMERLGPPAHYLGEIVAGDQVWWGEKPLEPTGGFQHFQSSSPARQQDLRNG
ncbi:MAG: thiamine-phosphate kinase [Gloeomargarita sp. SKYBB_i_bin120]|nr:thiamine-phosphate kinase [Gloeomargarita sp. SKYG98]MCS7291833.1 thiamine-phosphate kinase [Gloeomargarita sp. SKYB120]MDW8177393.1 thiamine-phosphate kinase [Gloeomargarita sp. SKYBB_i_bin120]